MNLRLREIRNYYNLSMRDFASKLGMSSGAISMLENGQRNMSSQFINSVCAVFTDINEEWFRTGEGDMLKPRDKEKELAELTKRLLKSDYNDVIAKIVRNLALLSFEDWQKLNEIIKKLLEDEKKDGSN